MDPSAYIILNLTWILVIACKFNQHPCWAIQYMNKFGSEVSEQSPLKYDNAQYEYTE